MKICLITIPYDAGHFNERLGAGPRRLRPYVIEKLQRAGHTIRDEEILDDTEFRTEIASSFALIRKTAACVKSAKESGYFPIIISGNCNTAALGVASGLKEKPSVIWFDCHGDFNTPETTIGGYFDGMAISILTGECWQQLTKSIPGYTPIPQEGIILVGARDLDPLEARRLSQSRILRIAEENIDTLPQQLPEKIGLVYLHVDLDVIDPEFVRVNTYSTSGGLTRSSLIQAIRTIKERSTLSAISFTAYDPAFDVTGKIPDLVNALLDVLLDEQ
jgi:arginase